MNEQIPELRKLISNGKTKIALDRILHHLNQTNHTILQRMRDDFLLLSSRFGSLESKLINGVVSFSDHELAENRLIVASIKLLNRLESSLQHELKDQSDQFWKVEKKKVNVIPRKNAESFFLQGPRGAKATGEPTTHGFLVFQGSAIAVSTVPSLRSKYQELRSSLIEEGVIVKEKEDFIFSEDFLFPSPSFAANIVLGRSANGLTEWKLASGKTLKAVRDQ